MNTLEITLTLHQFWEQINQSKHKEVLKELAQTHVILKAPIPLKDFLWWLQHSGSVIVRSA